MNFDVYVKILHSVLLLPRKFITLFSIIRIGMLQLRIGMLQLSRVVDGSYVGSYLPLIL